ncbi:hypothetical protein GCM10007304_17700 [Rhodococcoides trifolii]|uniref:Uncharacterized protein n=1 Tax=Rhodococcoides trifolii TaxID=908250 RepID=A0A917D001_9NOCA|nr:hypothetical protein [Rhodococcus trifolii]GGG04023.1 hypothetical protein GCM10007304_17700 [Rhodococcus trifolii]
MIRTLTSVAATLTTGGALALVTDANRTADYFLVASALTAWAFVGLYGTRSRWRLLNAGRSLLYVFVALALVLTQNAASVFLGADYFGRGVLRQIEYWSLWVALLGMLHTLWGIQRSERRTSCPNDSKWKGKL